MRIIALNRDRAGREAWGCLQHGKTQSRNAVAGWCGWRGQLRVDAFPFESFPAAPCSSSDLLHPSSDKSPIFLSSFRSKIRSLPEDHSCPRMNYPSTACSIPRQGAASRANSPPWKGNLYIKGWQKEAKQKAHPQLQRPNPKVSSFAKSLRSPTHGPGGCPSARI